MKIEVYTDGSCLGNPGPGGWGVILKTPSGELISESGGIEDCTNNRAELTAFHMGLGAAAKHIINNIEEDELDVIIYTDSAYIVNAINKGWLHKWSATDNFSGKKNEDLWKVVSMMLELVNVIPGMSLKIEWVKAHNGNYLNESVDTLARAEAELLNTGKVSRRKTSTRYKNRFVEKELML